MSISEKATEFAGFPVVEYDPAAGIVLSVMPRLELRSAKGDEFWAVSLGGERVAVQSGKVGAAGKAETKKLKSPAAAQEKYRQLVREKADAGFVPPPVRREFQHAQDPAKFWTVSVSGAKRSVTSGTVGTGSKSSSKQFKDEAAALADCRKLVAAKLAEGYVEKRPDA